MKTDARILRYLKPILFLLALVPFGWTVFDGFIGELGANPVEEITHRTGNWTLRLLLITLAITPLRRLTGWNWLIKLRRMLGLFAFFYVSLHFLTYAWLDAYFDLAYVAEDIIDRPYITAGFVSLCILLPLALTSTNGMVRRLGGKRWQALHRLVYVAGIGGVLHYLWLVKADLTEPLIYLAILVLLLALRVPSLSKKLGKVRSLRGVGSAAAQTTSNGATSHS